MVAVGFSFLGRQNSDHSFGHGDLDKMQWRAKYVLAIKGELEKLHSPFILLIFCAIVMPQH